MVKNIYLPIKFANKFDNKEKKEIFDFMSKSIIEIYKQEITKVYKYNSIIRDKENYVPLSQMLDAIKTEYQFSPASLSIFINEDEIIWKDKNGQRIHEVVEWIDNPTEQQWEYIGKERKRIENNFVTSFENYWKTPINGEQEDEYILDKVWLKIDYFIENDLFSFLIKKIKERG